MWALRETGVQRVLATAAVGSLRPHIGPGTLAVLEDFIDLSKRGPVTAFDRPEAGLAHTDFSQPYCPKMSQALRDSAQGLGTLPGVTYVGVDGPRYESPAEVRMLAQLGGDVVGMTAVPETILAREMGMCYACLAIVTNYGAGISDVPLEHEDVVRLVTERGNDVHVILQSAIQAVRPERSCRCARR
jgi:5'-methylthioadenosine phosphorylase